jgi:hypothetical protein
MRSILTLGINRTILLRFACDSASRGTAGSHKVHSCASRCKRPCYFPGGFLSHTLALWVILTIVLIPTCTAETVASPPPFPPASSPPVAHYSVVFDGVDDYFLLPRIDQIRCVSVWLKLDALQRYDTRYLVYAGASDSYFANRCVAWCLYLISYQARVHSLKLCEMHCMNHTRV